MKNDDVMALSVLFCTTLSLICIISAVVLFVLVKEIKKAKG